jgi:hypothetical protein
MWLATAAGVRTAITATHSVFEATPMFLSDNPFSSMSAYELRYLPEHLELANLDRTLARVLALETGKHKNAWYEAKEGAQW